MEERPVGEVLRGLAVGPLPGNWTPMDAVIIVKCLDEEGRSQWAWRSTSALGNREIIGAMTVQLDLARQQAVDEFEDPQGD